MQLMPQTAARMGVQNAMDPAANVEGGTRYLGELLYRYHNDLSKALAAYNAGPDRVEQYHGVPPYPETLAYVARIIGEFNRKKEAQRRLLPDRGSKRLQDQSSVATEFSVPGPDCIANTPIFRPEVTRLMASAMWMPVRSVRTIRVRMSASAAGSMMGLTG